MKQTENLGIGGIDWKDVDLSDSYERSRNIIDPLSFDTLLLEIECNIRDITEESIIQQFETDLNSRIMEAREILKDNLKNIVNKAREYREE